MRGFLRSKRTFSSWHLPKNSLATHRSPQIVKEFREHRKAYHIEEAIQVYKLSRRQALRTWEGARNEDGTANTCRFKCYTAMLYMQKRVGSKSKYDSDDMRTLFKLFGIKLNPSHLAKLMETLDMTGDGCVSAEGLYKFMNTIDIDTELRYELSRMANDIREADLQTSFAEAWKRDISKQLPGKQLPHERLRHKFLKQSTVAIVQAGIAGGQPIPGCDQTPMKLRWETPMIDDAIELGWDFEDYAIDFAQVWEETEPKYPDPPDVNMNDAHKIGVQSRELAMLNQQLIAENKFVVNIGGDHSMAFGTLGGILKSRPNIGVVWVDAHADINSPETSPTGNLHGMPMSALMKISDYRRFPGWEWLDTFLDTGSIVFIGLRDLDPLEKKILSALSIHVFDVNDVANLGIGQVMKMTNAILNPGGTRPLHLSLDIDGIDGAFAPSTGTVADGGLSKKESLFIVSDLARSGCLCSMDLAEINTEILMGAPAGDSSSVITKSMASSLELTDFELTTLEKNPRKTLMLGKELILTALGQTYK